MKRNAWMLAFLISMIHFWIPQCLAQDAYAGASEKVPEDAMLLPAIEASRNGLSIDWISISANEKYGKFFSPDLVRITETSKEQADPILPTKVIAWIRTSYSDDAGKETLSNYGVAVPSGCQLSFSYSLIEACPQERTIRYLKEVFFDPTGKAIWATEAPGKLKEINSQEFDEDFYAAIVDSVFRMGETARLHAKDRWIDLYDEPLADGMVCKVSADTSTMRLHNGNLVFWEWAKIVDASGNTTQIRFLKKSVQLAKGMELVVAGSIWDKGVGWKDYAPSQSEGYLVIPKNSPKNNGLVRLNAFAKGYSMWVSRYQKGAPNHF